MDPSAPQTRHSQLNHSRHAQAPGSSQERALITPLGPRQRDCLATLSDNLPPPGPVLTSPKFGFRVTCLPHGLFTCVITKAPDDDLIRVRVENIQSPRRPISACWAESGSAAELRSHQTPSLLNNRVEGRFSSHNDAEERRCLSHRRGTRGLSPRPVIGPPPRRLKSPK